MKKFILLLTLFSITACSKNAKKTWGLTETIPDEYKVTRNKPLEVPPSYNGAI